MKKQIVRLTESDLHRIIKESVKRIIREQEYGDWRDDYEKYKNFYGDPDEGEKLRKAYLNRTRSEFGGDEKARVKALNKHMSANDAEREKRLSSTDPDFLAWEKAWSRKYDNEHGVNANDDNDFSDFETEKAKAAAQLDRKRIRVNRQKNNDISTPVDTKFSGKSPEEIEQMMRDMGFAK